MSKRPYRRKIITEEEKAINKSIGKKVKAARLAKKFSQTKVANKIFVTFQQIQKYEKGLNGLSTIRLLQVSNILDEPLEYFVGDAKELVSQVKPLADSSNVSVAIAPSLVNEELN